jgi:predicted DsbA family dithiol-disulfide isomerase
VEKAILHSEKLIKVVYFTDPICSSCWGIEPQLRKLKLEYGDLVDIEYRMGGLLPSWDIYNSGGISKPSDVAHHWDEVSAYYDMPIDGDVWLTDPLPSSYPPSIAFKAAALQNHEKALLFLRKIREMVFLEQKNICKWEYLATAATAVGLDAVQLKKDFEGKAKSDFEADLALGKQLGVRGFPTLFFNDANSNRLTVYGFRPYEAFEKAVVSLLENAPKKIYQKDLSSLFAHYPTLTKKEFSILANTTTSEAEILLNQGVTDKKLNKLNTKNGAIWRLKN